MKVCIIGGGHIGTTLACYIKHNDESKTVCLFTRKPDKFGNMIKCNDIEGEFSYEVGLDEISDNPCIVNNADIIFVALPHFAIEKAFSDVSPYVKKDVFIGVLPGGGGCEFYFGKYFGEEATLFGFQRVPFTAKLVTYGLETNLKSWKPFSVVGTLKRERNSDACRLIEECGLKTKRADNYLEIALTPTNPIFHTARMYDLFGDYDRNHVFTDKMKFYVGWSDNASKTLLDMDDELHCLLDKIDVLETSAIRPLTEHYESYTVTDMTKKINSIPTFQSVYAPLKKNPDGEGYVADTEMRMFSEDFPWGLAIFRAYCLYYDISAPTMDKVLKWYSDYMGYEWYVDGQFIGKDLCKTGIPNNYGISDKNQIEAFYLG